ncbi:MAG: efflux RND transporter periplasmic adaptor subunit [Bacteroidetes bacterium]|nr:efflux RND transporter periplasmic adaptor subunit [Bacteroidota bacterium]
MKKHLVNTINTNQNINNMNKIMKSIWAIMVAAIIMQACAPKTDLATKKAELKDKKTELKKLETEIDSLEAEIAKLDSSHHETKHTLVMAANPRKGVFRHFIQIPGRADSRQNIVVSAESMGNITRIVGEEGQMVKKGQVLASIESEVVSTQINELKTRLDLATQLYEKQKRLWDQKIGSEVQYLQAKNNKESLEASIKSLQAQQRNSSIIAPINGYVDRVFIREGQLVNMGSPAFRVVDLNNIRVEIEVSEAYIGQFEKGDTAYLKFPSIDKEYKAPIKTIGQVVSADDRTFLVEVELDNKDGKIKPNVLADVRIVTYKNKEAIILPTSLVQQGKSDDYVYVVSTENNATIAKKQTIKVGMSYNGKSEILEGLSTKDLVITQGGRIVSNGEPIEVKNQE